MEGKIEHIEIRPAGVFTQPGWDHVMAAFVAGALELRANPSATEADIARAADGYTKRVHEEVDPETERRLRQNDWPEAAA